MVSTVLKTDCPTLKLLARGKVRDIYDLGEQGLLFVATDRLSCYDVVLKSGIPGKGKILTQMSVFWFKELEEVFPNHLIASEWKDMPEEISRYESQLEGRSLLVRKLNVLPVEAIVRGYITGSGWNEYLKKGTVCDIALPKGLLNSQKLEAPLFTPSTKAEAGHHDENIHPSRVKTIVGDRLADAIEDAAVTIYKKAAAIALEKGIIIADTKFEFGVDNLENLVLIDEVLTPDSSRFWPAKEYEAGKTQNSFDKQYVRDYLTSINFDKETPVELPQDVVDKTVEKYLEVYRLLTGESITL